MPTNEGSSSLGVAQPRPGKKYFTLDEASRALPFVSRVVDDIVACYHEVIDLGQQLEHANPSDAGELRDRYNHGMDRLNELIEELQTIGVELKDFERGLIDFPAIHEDREIYLCWRRGEPRIAAWHELDAGFVGRRDVAELTS